MSYSLQLVDVSDVSFLDKEIELKVALVHNQSGGVGGREQDTPFQITASYKNDPDKRLVSHDMFNLRSALLTGILDLSTCRRSNCPSSGHRYIDIYFSRRHRAWIGSI
jgi:hypothetical protein